MRTAPLVLGTDFVNSVVCPDCGSENSHQGAVEVFSRDGEDSKTGLHAVVDGTVSVDRTMYGNPSSRRDGLRVKIQCEQCGYNFALVVAQHKGVTEIYLEI